MRQNPSKVYEIGTYTNVIQTDIAVVPCLNLESHTHMMTREETTSRL